MDPPGTVGDATGDVLDLEAVKMLATEENYEMVYYSRESRLISFQPRGVGNEDENDVRINVYWTVGTVGTCLDYHTQGKSQLFRRNVGFGDLCDIFRNPRVQGVGYYQSQDVTDVHTAADDNTHIDILQETNQMLREQLNGSQRIEITGRRADPVYATGSFRDGRWALKRGGLWEVNLDMVQPYGSDVAVPISVLDDIEIRLGGILYASASSHKVHAQMGGQDWDGDMRKEVLCHFGGPVTGVWLAVRIAGWPESHWSVIQSRNFSRRKNEYRQDLDVYEVLLENVSDLYPNATLSFHILSFFGECVEQMIDNLGLSPQPEAEKQEEEELWNIANLIVTTLRSAGNEDVGDELMKRVNDIQMGAYMMLTMNNASYELVESEIPTLVELQLGSHSTAEFLSQVQMRYGIQALDDNISLS